MLKTAAVALAFGSLFLSQKTVHAAQSEQGALVIHGCPDTVTFYGRSVGYTYNVCADITFTPSGDVNATLHGELLDPSTAPSHAVIVRDFPCEYKGEVTYDSEIIITPDGSVNGRCDSHNH